MRRTPLLVTGLVTGAVLTAGALAGYATTATASAPWLSSLDGSSS